MPLGASAPKWSASKLVIFIVFITNKVIGMMNDMVCTLLKDRENLL